MTLQQLKILLVGYLPDHATLSSLPAPQVVQRLQQMHATRPALLMYLLPVATVFIPELFGPLVADLLAPRPPGTLTNVLALTLVYARPVCWVMAFLQMAAMVPVIFRRQRAREFLRERGLPLYPQ